MVGMRRPPLLSVLSIFAAALSPRMRVSPDCATEATGRHAFRNAASFSVAPIFASFHYASRFQVSRH